MRKSKKAGFIVFLISCMILSPIPQTLAEDNGTTGTGNSDGNVKQITTLVSDDTKIDKEEIKEIQINGTLNFSVPENIPDYTLDYTNSYYIVTNKNGTVFKNPLSSLLTSTTTIESVIAAINSSKVNEDISSIQMLYSYINMNNDGIKQTTTVASDDNILNSSETKVIQKGNTASFSTPNKYNGYQVNFSKSYLELKNANDNTVHISLDEAIQSGGDIEKFVESMNSTPYASDTKSAEIYYYYDTDEKTEGGINQITTVVSSDGKLNLDDVKILNKGEHPSFEVPHNIVDYTIDYSKSYIEFADIKNVSLKEVLSDKMKNKTLLDVISDVNTISVDKATKYIKLYIYYDYTKLVSELEQTSTIISNDNKLDTTNTVIFNTGDLPAFQVPPKYEDYSINYDKSYLEITNNENEKAKVYLTDSVNAYGDIEKVLKEINNIPYADNTIKAEMVFYYEINKDNEESDKDNKIDKVDKGEANGGEDDKDNKIDKVDKDEANGGEDNKIDKVDKDEENGTEAKSSPTINTSKKVITFDRNVKQSYERNKKNGVAPKTGDFNPPIIIVLAITILSLVFIIKNILKKVKR